MGTPSPLSSRATRRRAQRLLLLSAVAFLLTAFAVACWVLPCRAALAPNGGLYGFSVIPDEFAYAWRMQPLITGATTANVVNRFHDPAVISPFFLEDFVRGMLTVTGLPVAWMFWIWRFAFPLALAAAVWVAAGACLAVRRRPWSQPLRCAASLGGVGALYVLSHLTSGTGDIALYLDRIPTNLEYPLAFLLAWAWLRLAAAPSVRRGMVLACLGALLVYLRPYAVIPWGTAIALHLLYRIVRQTLPHKTWLDAAGTLVVLLAPWLAIAYHNSQSPVYAQMYARYYSQWPYQVHPRWAVHLGAAALLAAMAWRVARDRRAMLTCMAATAAALPFISGLFREAQELLLFERYGSFYVVALVAGAMLVLDEEANRRHGKLAAGFARRAAGACFILSLGSSGALSVWHSQYDFEHNPWTQLRSLSEDRQYIPSYQWIARHTPADAFFLVDDGIDWSVVPPSSQVMISHYAPDGAELYQRGDYFQLLARRQRVFNEWLWAFALSDGQYIELAALQRGTFGYPIPVEDYKAFLKRYRPGYVFWRRKAPVPRGYGKQLSALAEVVYSDAVCEVWRLKYE